MSILGFDPGGIKNFGVACVSLAGDAKCLTVSSAQEAFDAFDVDPIGVGVDAPLWWSTVPGGGRECDQWIRKTHTIPSGSVQSINSLRGAAIAQGLLVANMISNRFPKCTISEANPKALIQALGVGFDDFLNQNLRSYIYKNEHERDALICAISCKQGIEGNWPRDLSSARPESERQNQPYQFDPRYFWPV